MCMRRTEGELAEDIELNEIGSMLEVYCYAIIKSKE